MGKHDRLLPDDVLEAIRVANTAKDLETGIEIEAYDDIRRAQRRIRGALFRAQQVSILVDKAGAFLDVAANERELQNLTARFGDALGTVVALQGKGGGNLHEEHRRDEGDVVDHNWATRDRAPRGRGNTSKTSFIRKTVRRSTAWGRTLIEKSAETFAASPPQPHPPAQHLYAVVDASAIFSGVARPRIESCLRLTNLIRRNEIGLFATPPIIAEWELIAGIGSGESVVERGNLQFDLAAREELLGLISRAIIDTEASSMRVEPVEDDPSDTKYLQALRRLVELKGDGVLVTRDGHLLNPVKDEPFPQRQIFHPDVFLKLLAQGVFGQNQEDV